MLAVRDEETSRPFPLAFEWHDSRFLSNKWWHRVYELAAAKQGPAWVLSTVLDKIVTTGRSPESFSEAEKEVVLRLLTPFMRFADLPDAPAGNGKTGGGGDGEELDDEADDASEQTRAANQRAQVHIAFLFDALAKERPKRQELQRHTTRYMRRRNLRPAGTGGAT